jgi:hypothetical protein
MDNLKPCPCGKDCNVSIGREVRAYDWTAFWIESECGWHGPECDSREKAIAAWNTRPGEDAAVAAERERIIHYITTHQQKCYVAHGRTMTGVHVLPLIDAIRVRGGSDGKRRADL